MKAQDYWDLFLETGLPEAYLLYNKARKMEVTHVFDGSGSCTEGHTLQGL